MSDEADVQEWIKYADDDLEAARVLFEAGRYAMCAFHCQQALEKILKAAIVRATKARPPYIHNLRDLATHLPAPIIPDEIGRTLRRVDPHYRATRYPGLADSGEYTRVNVQRLFEQTRIAYEWFLSRLK
ncbi:MAG TPA: HEPN domain-containing protein [Anaerolineae bacterium]